VSPWNIKSSSPSVWSFNHLNIFLIFQASLASNEPIVFLPTFTPRSPSALAPGPSK
jgi:hypothetical protein